MHLSLLPLDNKNIYTVSHWKAIINAYINIYNLCKTMFLRFSMKICIFVHYFLCFDRVRGLKKFIFQCIKNFKILLQKVLQFNSPVTHVTLYILSD